MNKISTDVLRESLQNAEFEKFFDLLLSETNGTPFQRTSEKHSFRYNEIKRKSINHTISFHEESLATSQLVENLLIHISHIEKNQLKYVYQPRFRKLFFCIIGILFICAILLFTFIGPLNKGEFVFDNRDWAIYKTAKKGGYEFMIENLNNNSKDIYSWAFDDDSKNSKKFGRLYDFENAQKGCTGLGDGWRVPTREEVEYILGPLPQKNDVTNMLGGGRGENGDFFYLNKVGHIWTTSRSIGDHYWIIYAYGDRQVLDWFEYGDSRHGYSCRCIRTINQN